MKQVVGTGVRQVMGTAVRQVVGTGVRQVAEDRCETDGVGQIVWDR